MEDMNNLNDKDLVLTKSQFNIKTLSKVVVFVLLLTLPFVGFYLGYRYKLERFPDSENSNSKSLKTNDNENIFFTENVSSILPLLLSPSLKSQLVDNKFEKLSCLPFLPVEADWDIDEKILNKIRKLEYYKGLVGGIEEIYSHEFEVAAIISKGEDPYIDGAKLEKKKANIKIFSLCNFNEGYVVLYNTVFNWEATHKNVSEVASIVYAGGGFVGKDSYLSFIDNSGNVDYYKISGSNVSQDLYEQITAESLRKYGYKGERRLDYLYPHRILGKIGDQLLLTLEDRCSECHDNPMERSLFLFSPVSVKAKEISFCFDYESPSYTCYDSYGKYLSFE